MYFAAETHLIHSFPISRANVMAPGPSAAGTAILSVVGMVFAQSFYSIFILRGLSPCICLDLVTALVPSLAKSEKAKFLN